MTQQIIEYFLTVPEYERREEAKPACSPALIDRATCTYRASYEDVIITNVRVGMIPWDEVKGEPGPGQWAAGPGRGVFRLGGDPCDGEVRCDVIRITIESQADVPALQIIDIGRWGG